MKNKEKIASLTAYTAPIARACDEVADLILVGDSLGMVLYNMESTLSVTLEMMIRHAKAVVSSTSRALVITDMPFGSYQKSKEDAFDAAAKIISETGSQGVKLEGGEAMQETIQFLVERGIPVMAHIGMMPQHVNNYGGYRYQGKTREQSQQILKDAKAVEEAGAFSVVLECVPAALATKITKKLTIPTIGIGASKDCDGQILVTEDVLGLTENAPKFVTARANLFAQAKEAAAAYAKAVKK